VSPAQTLPAHRALSPSRRVALAGEILATYARVRLHLRRADLPEVLAALRATGAVPAAGSAREGRRLGRAVVRTLSVLPTDSRCLMRSLVLVGLLARRGVDGRLVLAVSGTDDFVAHAWVELDGEALLEPGGPGMHRLTTL
jgi:hypothetical protein